MLIRVMTFQVYDKVLFLTVWNACIVYHLLCFGSRVLFIIYNVLIIKRITRLSDLLFAFQAADRALDSYWRQISENLLQSYRHGNPHPVCPELE